MFEEHHVCRLKAQTGLPDAKEPYTLKYGYKSLKFPFFSIVTLENTAD